MRAPAIIPITQHVVAFTRHTKTWLVLSSFLATKRETFARPRNSEKSLRTDGWTRRLAEERVGGAKIPSVGEPCGDHAWTVLGGRRKRESR